MPALGDRAVGGGVRGRGAGRRRDAARWFRHATVAARILALFMAFLLPALLLYPSVNFFAARAVRIGHRRAYAVEAKNHPQMLQARLDEVRDEIDALPALPDLVQRGADAVPTGAAGPRPRILRLAPDRARARAPDQRVELYDATARSSAGSR